MIAGGDAAVYSAGYAFNVAPVTDNQPFFFFTLKLSNIFHPARAGKGMNWKVNMGVLVLFALLAISALAVLAFLIVPLALAGSAGGIEKLPLLYFVAISLRYILTEMVLIRRSNVCDYRGCFSHASGQWPGQSNVPIMDENRVSMAGRDSRYRGGQRGLLLRSAVVAHAPGGFGDRDQADVECAADRAVGVPNGDAVPHRIAGAGPEAWRQRGVAWALNAAASVLGSALAIVIALQFGLTAVLLTAAAIYALSAALSYSLKLRTVDLENGLSPAGTTAHRSRQA